MQSAADTPKAYIDSLPAERKAPVQKLRSTLRKHLPKGFKETMGYGMLAYVVPHRLYPDGYHVNPDLPLPFINVASQKQFVGFYHMGIYADKKLHRWFVSEYARQCSHKLDMGKSCVRFKKLDDIPYELIAELATKISVEDWISTYEKSRRR